MKRYDTHRNFPPPRRPRDSTPAPPEEDELERLLTASQPVPPHASTPPVQSVEREPKSEAELSPPAPSSVASAVTAYVESLPASDPEPRLEDREIDVDAEAARRVGRLVLVEESAAVSASASSADGEDEDEEDDEDEASERFAPKSSHGSESAPADSIGAVEHSMSREARSKRGTAPALWIAGFGLGGTALALFWMGNYSDMQGRAAADPPTTVVISPARPEPLPAEPAANPPPPPSGSVTPPPAAQVR